ncbi:SUMF1/EgtB/PvdO family nonheme iron enzyme [bacterium]|nr:SUMF1/EgtB/PvdO family nonheme iron enzyme [bacterium]
MSNQSAGDPSAVPKPSPVMPDSATDVTVIPAAGRNKHSAVPAPEPDPAAVAPETVNNASHDGTSISNRGGLPGDSATGLNAVPSHAGALSESGAPASSTFLEAPGAVLGQYKLVEKIGQGGMGSVWKALHLRLDKHVALKLLPASWTQDPALLSRFDREMKAVAKLEHPHIVRAMDAGEAAGHHYLVMELVEGSDLSAWVKKRGPQKVADACEMLRHAAQGLAHAHDNGLIHRDIKPSNLFLTKQGKVKILDLGLVRVQGDVEAGEAGTITGFGQIIGTPDYMAPEQWENTHAVDARCDLYALGCTLFYLLTGRPPYGETRYSTLVSKMKGHTVESIPDLITARREAIVGRPKLDGDEVTPEVNAIYQRLLAKDPAERFASATELVAALEPHSRSKIVAERSKDAASAAAPSAPASAATAASVSEAPADSGVVPFEPPSSILLEKPVASSASDPGPLAASSAVSASPAPQIDVAEEPSARGSRSRRGSSPPPRRKLLLGAAAAAVIVLLGVILITIKKPDGTETKITVPDGTDVDLSQLPPGSKIEVAAAPSSSGSEPSKPASAGWHGWPADAPKPAIAPFDADEARQHQEAWAKYLNVPVEYENSIGMKFRLIPPGEFTMGGTPAEIAAALEVEGDKNLHPYIQSGGPQHLVTLTQPVYLGVYEVTQIEYEQVMGTNPSHFTPMGIGKDLVAGIDTTTHPVEMVSWNDAAEFCAKLSQQEKFKPYYFRAGETITPLDGTGYRLPSEAEWEFACRAGTITKYWVGDKYDDLMRAGWFGENSGGRTHSVGELKGNPFELYDVHGNVFEWVDDWWDTTYRARLDDKLTLNPTGSSTGAFRVVRGGEWYFDGSNCRSSRRYVGAPDWRWSRTGFRVSLPVDAVRQALKVPGPAMARSEIANPESQISNPPSQISASLPPIDFAAERKAAERVLALGGRVQLIDDKGQTVGLVDGQLPDSPFAIASVYLSDLPKVTDADLDVLRGCQRLRSLKLKFASIDGSGLANISHLRTLTELWLDGTKLNDAGLANVAPLKQLQVLSLDYADNVTDAGLAHLQDLVHLRTLILPTTVTDNEIPVLSRLTELREVWVTSWDLTDAGVAQIIARNPNLERLMIRIGNRTLGPLAATRKLRWVAISGDQLTPEGLRILQGLPTLDSIHFNSGMTDEQVARLGEIPQLRHVEIYYWHGGGTRLADSALLALKRLPKLESITVQGGIDSPPDAVLAEWATIPTLKVLRLWFEESRIKYTPDGIAKFRELRPDVYLATPGKDYPPSTTIPFSVIQKLDETDPLPAWELPDGSPPPVVAPCPPQRATELQQQWAEHLKRPVVETLDVAALAVAEVVRLRKDVADAAPQDRTLTSSATLKFALIPPGEFRKIFTRPRDPAIEPDMPVRRFRITKPYAMSTTEVTWDQFRQFVDATGYKTEAEASGTGGMNRAFQRDPNINWRTPGWKPDPNEPVTQVTPRDAEAFCAWLTEQSGSRSRETSDERREPKSHDFGYVYRLPTEAEWLHACRAGSVFKHVVGLDSKDLADYAWSKEFLDPDPTASPLHLVGTKKANPFGLHDTLGNVWEYTRDYLTLAGIPYLPTNDPMSYGIGTIHGSGWDCQDQMHPEFDYTGSSTPQSNVGFRVLQQLDAEPLPGPLDRPLVVRAGQPLSVHALVPRPEKIPGLQSWSIELAGPHVPVSVAIASSPKGDLIATGGYGSTKISLWDRDGNYQRALLGHEDVVTSLDFSPDGRWLASCNQLNAKVGSGSAQVWNVETGALHAVIPLGGWGVRVTFSPDSKQLAASFAKGISIVDLATGHTRSPQGDAWIHGVAWSPDGTELAGLLEGDHLRVWDVKTLKVLKEAEAPCSDALEWSPDGDWLAMGARDRTVAIRNAKTLEVTRTFGLNVNGHSSDLAWLPDSKRLAVAADGGAGSVFDVTTGEQLVKFDHHGTSAIAIINEGKEAVLESYSRLHFYDTSTGQKLREGKERGEQRGWTTLTRSGDSVLAAGMGAKLRRFDSARGTASESQLPFGVSTLIPAPDETLIAATSQHFGYPMWIVDAKTYATKHELPHNKAHVTRVAWSPDGTWLATGATDKLVRVWNVATGKIEHELAGHTGTIWSVAWSPDGTRLASAAEDKTVRLWDPLAGKLVAAYDQFPEPKLTGGWQEQAFAWSADSRRLWIALNTSIVSLDVESGTFGPLENFSNGNAVASLFPSPDGQRLLAREGYGWTFVRGRDAQDRRLLGQRLGTTAQWHPDSRRFLGWENGYGTISFDVETNRRLGMLFPWLTGDHWLCLGPTGHYRGSAGVEDQIVYVAMLADGSQQTFTPADFAEKFGWKNDPEKAELLGTAVTPDTPAAAPAIPKTTSTTTAAPTTPVPTGNTTPPPKKPAPAKPATVASLTPSKPSSISVPKTSVTKPAEPVAVAKAPQALTVPVSAPKVDVPAVLPKPLRGRPVSVRQIVTTPVPLKDLAGWSIESAGNLGAVHAISWSPNGEFLMTGGSDDALRLWRVEAGPGGPQLQLHSLLLGERGGIQDAHFSPDGRTIGVNTFYGHQIAFYDVATGRRLSAFDLTSGAQGRTLQWTSDGKQILSSHAPLMGILDPLKGQLRQCAV